MIRRLKRAKNITIFEHPEIGENQCKQLAERSANIVKAVIRTLKSSTESNFGEARLIHCYPGSLSTLHSSVTWWLPTAEPAKKLGEKVLFSPLPPARRRDFGARCDNGIYLGCGSLDDQTYTGTLSGVIRCRTVRQLITEERSDREFVQSIKGTSWSLNGEGAGNVNIRVNLPQNGGDRGAHPPDIDLTGEMSEGLGLTAPRLGCSAARTGVGCPANHTELCRERIEREL